MWRFVVDEDMPRSTAPALGQAGWPAEDVRDVGLAGQGDPPVLAYGQAHGAILVTEDKGFTNPLRYPLGGHAGILVLRLPGALPVRLVNAELPRALGDLAGQDLVGTLAIVELGRMRMRRPRPR
jgi:predicted nuclease of predicted toxin-antitoxin system